MAIVKADGYGHGVEAVARALSDCVQSFGVANVSEAQELTEVLGKAHAWRVLILSPLLPGERIDAIAGGFAVTVSNQEEVDGFLLAAKAAGKAARLHAVVDTGMGRMGARVEDFPVLVDRIRQLDAETRGAVCLAGVASHFPSADEDADYTRDQIARFRELLDALELASLVRVHLANSAGLLGFGGEIGFTTEARPGLALYGVSPLARHQAALRPAMAWKTRISLIRELTSGDSVSYGRSYVADRPLLAATLAAGYADGYPRAVSGRGAEVLIAGRRCPLLGRVTMDQMVVDVSALPTTPQPGQEAVLMGVQESEHLSATELAEKAGTIPWEILTGITARVVRRYR